ncbi:MAG TPA: GNAT family N-acetyltransferase [Opitutaceae bacterium]|jgi:ribosomal protein S18 acetylase RimI-like enzyme|nr:GNAT family N-acetyltransferase [Opitutaceae bacterium]
MNLRILTSNDIPAIATIHLMAFPRAAVSRLGRGAARRYYDSLMSGRYGTVGLGAFEQDQLSGFCFVGVRHSAEIFYVRRHALFLAWRIMTHPWLLTEAFICDRIRSGLRLLLPRSRRPITGAPAGENSQCSYGIQYLAVDPSCQGHGVGKQLLRASEEIARQQGCVEIHLSVYLDNSKAIGLYEQMGWRKISSDGVWRGLMFKRLAKAGSADVPSLRVNRTQPGLKDNACIRGRAL